MTQKLKLHVATKFHVNYDLQAILHTKENSMLCQIDIKDFYPSISETILENDISLAKEHIHIRDNHQEK